MHLEQALFVQVPGTAQNMVGGTKSMYAVPGTCLTNHAVYRTLVNPGVNKPIASLLYSLESLGLIYGRGIYASMY